MSRIISRILVAKEPHFSHTLAEWEKQSGRNGHDLRLVSDIKLRAHKAVRELGLDHEDTTPRELFFALQEKIRLDSVYFENKIAVTSADKPGAVVKKVVEWLDKQEIHRDVWVVKSSLAKNTLKKQPPKLVMKALALRSVDSMLKRNNPCELLPLAFELEKPEWVHKFRQTYKKLKPNDFQSKAVSVHVIEDADRITKLKKAGFPLSRVVNSCPELGSVLIVPSQARFDSDALAIAVSLLEAIADIRRQSAYYRALSVRKDFGQRVFDVSEKGIVGASSELSHVGWSSLHKHLIGNQEFFETIEQPYFEHNDLHVSSPAHVLEVFDSKLSFWNGLDHVFYVKDGEPPVSINLVDVITNRSNRYSYSSSYASYARARLWEELWSRYLAHDRLAQNVSEHFLGDDKL